MIKAFAAEYPVVSALKLVIFCVLSYYHVVILACNSFLFQVLLNFLP